MDTMSKKASTKHKAGVKQKPKLPHEEKEAAAAVPVMAHRLLLGLTERQIALFLLEFLLLSAGLLWVWYQVGEYYQAVVFFVARLILLAMGYTAEQIAGLDFSGAYLVNFNLVPLLALAVATPKLVLRRRLQLLAIGVPILFALHVLDSVAHLSHFIEYYYLHRLGFATLIVDSLGVIGLAVVFVIWFAICYTEFFSRSVA
jgi:hypothetical protein